MQRLQFIFCGLLISISTFAQQAQKSMTAMRVNTPPKINGVLDDEAWRMATPGKDFIQYQTANGKPARQVSKLYIAYDNTAIYVGAMLYDKHPDSIPRELGVRDDLELNADYFSFNLNPYNDGQNENSFAVTSSGVQVDCKRSAANEDYEWNPVWQSAVAFNDSGWVVEMKIPYSAIRFPEAKGQAWGVNVFRYNMRTQDISTWNYVDNSKDEIANQAGLLLGISNINAPLRLSFSPYVSSYLDYYPYAEKNQKKINFLYNGGMDLKYGINESFTLDMTLVPDFGQVQSDDIILNLSPFEVKYEENRPFFTEGTELFNRAGLFYSRRIGAEPIGYENLSENIPAGDSVISNPNVTRLINATKVSGRTKQGLGIGIFNAVTANTYATVQDGLGIKNKILTQPLTNYNIVVLDQTIKKNSYVSFINTNTSYDRIGNMANVSGTDFKLADKKNKYALCGVGAVSEKFDSTNTTSETGYKYMVGAGKIAGNFKYFLSNEVLSDKFDINDVGYLTNNNEINTDLEVSYSFYEPFSIFQNMRNSLTASRSAVFLPRRFSRFELETNSQATFNNFSVLSIQLNKADRMYDFYEPRTTGRVFIRPPSWYFIIEYCSDTRKRFNIYGYFGYCRYEEGFKASPWGEITFNFRVNNHLSFSYGFLHDTEFHDYGYAATDSVIHFGKRDVQRIENTLKGNYIFNDKLSLNLYCRHYWSTVKYYSYYTLNEDGTLSPSTYFENHDESFNAFNVDMVLRWRFAPGSELSFVWKNQIVRDDVYIINEFTDNFQQTVQSPQLNSVSLKILYYLDYLYLKKKK